LLVQSPLKGTNDGGLRVFKIFGVLLVFLFDFYKKRGDRYRLTPWFDFTGTPGKLEPAIYGFLLTQGQESDSFLSISKNDRIGKFLFFLLFPSCPWNSM